MTRRDILPAGDTAAHRAWIAAALVAEFQTPRKLPSLRMPKDLSEPNPLPDLFRDLLVEAAPPKPVAPVRSDFSAEELAALDAFAAGWGASDSATHAQRLRWESFIEHGAHAERRHEIQFAKRSRTDAAALVTRTRLGFTSGWSYGTDKDGAADGGALIPMADEIGWYVWRTRDAALRDGLHHLWLATREQAPSIARVVQAHCHLVDGIDVTVPAPEEARRRLLARADWQAAAARALQAGAPDVPEDDSPSEDRKAFERSAGLTDVDGPPTDEPAPVGTPIDVLLRAHFGDALPPQSPLTLKRRELKRQRAAAAAAKAEEPEPVAEDPVPTPVPEPVLDLTFDMGRFQDAHMLDRCEPGESGYVVTSPPFHLHDEDEVEPVDEFLGQVVGNNAGRALLFRRRDPCVMDGCEVGQRYVLVRFGDDEDGQVWSMPVEGEEDVAVLQAIRTTTSLYRGWQRKAA